MIKNILKYSNKNNYINIFVSFYNSRSLILKNIFDFEEFDEENKLILKINKNFIFLNKNIKTYDEIIFFKNILDFDKNNKMKNFYLKNYYWLKTQKVLIKNFVIYTTQSDFYFESKEGNPISKNFVAAHNNSFKIKIYNTHIYPSYYPYLKIIKIYENKHIPSYTSNTYQSAPGRRIGLYKNIYLDKLYIADYIPITQEISSENFKIYTKKLYRVVYVKKNYLEAEHIILQDSFFILELPELNDIWTNTTKLTLLVNYRKDITPRIDNFKKLIKNNGEVFNYIKIKYPDLKEIKLKFKKNICKYTIKMLEILKIKCNELNIKIN